MYKKSRKGKLIRSDRKYNGERGPEVVKCVNELRGLALRVDCRMRGRCHKFVLFPSASNGQGIAKELLETFEADGYVLYH